MSITDVATNSFNWSLKDGSPLQIAGTIVATQYIQAIEREYPSGKVIGPATWRNGDPKLNIRVLLVQSDGSFISFQASKASKAQREHRKPSLHVQLLDLCTDGRPLEGRTIQVTTWPANPSTGQEWGLGNPRLFDVQELQGVGPFQANAPIPADFLVDTLLLDDGAHGGQPMQAQQPVVQQAVPQVMPQQYVAPQQPQAVAGAQVTQPVTIAQPVATEATAAAASAQIPAGMDPAVAAAMQTLGATNIQPVADPVKPEEGMVYTDCPF